MDGANGQIGGKNCSSTFVLTHSFLLADLKLNPHSYSLPLPYTFGPTFVSDGGGVKCSCITRSKVCLGNMS
jgi:hypothetical protein